MSLGSPRLTLRVPEELLDRLSAELARHNAHSAGARLSLSELLVRLIEDSLGKRARSRATRRRPPVTTLSL